MTYLFDFAASTKPHKRIIIEELTSALIYECDSPGLYEIREDLFLKAKEEIKLKREKTKALDITKEDGQDRWERLKDEVEIIKHCVCLIRAKRLEKILDMARDISVGAADEWKEKNCATEDERDFYTELNRVIGKVAGDWGIGKEELS